ncbi:MAG: cytidylate kinase-like family protein [Agathobacter sp.]|jgi:cytidylate kinase|nr:cytidylate kinase-like family protein [Agathobacter sp.]
MDKQLIIALGREVGSGGHEIAEKLAKYYNIPLIDKNIIEEIANKKNVDATDLREVEKNFMFPLVNRNVRGFSSSIQENVYLLQFEHLQEKAKAGESFIIVGRCGEDILKEYDALVSIFVLGDKEVKRARIMERYGKNEFMAERMMREKDTERKRYHNSFCEGKWGDSRSYDISVNSSVLGIEGTAELLIDFIDRKRNK